MVDAGYLNSAKEIRGGAAEMFFKHRDEIILEKVNAGGPESEAYDFLPREDFIRDKSEFPTFHRNWIDGILTSCLKILNFAGSVYADYAAPVVPPTPPVPPGPIHDPMFVFAHAGAGKPPAMVTEPPQGIDAIIKYFALPAAPGSPWPGAVDLGIKDPAPDAAVSGPESIKTIAFNAALATITDPSTQYKKGNPKEFIPLVPSDEFPNIDYPTGDQKELSLQSKQELLFVAVIDALDDLINKIKATPNTFLFPISTGVNPAPPKPQTGQQQPGPGLVPIFTAAKLALDKFLPDPKAAADDAITNIANFEALKRLLIKPLYLTAIGVLFGSHPKGFTGLMGFEAPDAVKTFNEKNLDTKPEKLNLEETQASAEPAMIGDLGTSRLLTTLSLEECSDRNQQRKNVDQFKFSIHALKWLIQKEGGVIKTIFDDGTHMMTIGLGHLLHTAKMNLIEVQQKYPKDKPYTDSQVYGFMVMDLYKTQNAARLAVAKVESGGPRLLFTQYEYDVLVMWAFGFGFVYPSLVRAAKNSKPKPGRISPYYGAADEIMNYLSGTGKDANGKAIKQEIPGMRLRRQMESILWELGDYDAYAYHKTADKVQAAMFKGEAIKGEKLTHSKSKNGSYDLQDGDISPNKEFNISTVLPKLYAAEAEWEAKYATITLNANHTADTILKKDHGIPSSIV